MPFASTGRQVQDVLADLKVHCSECNTQTRLMIAKLAISEKGRVVPLCATCGAKMTIGHTGSRNSVDFDGRLLKREVVSLINDLRRANMVELKAVHGD